MSLAKIANGTLLKIGDGILVSGIEGFTTVPEVTKLSGPSIKFDLVDVTSHDSAGFFREFLPGLKDGDMITADMNWRPSNVVHKGMRIDNVAATLRSFRVVFPDTPDNTVTASAYVQDITPKADIGTALTATTRLKITGNMVWS